ncbi:hypothetical protein SETIT_6G147900v2 [Setaria italica]|uniref:DUF8039 domain-containing protein n=1 Tax=Setaria italica TaxID=4555 RepID=A0A368RNA2_SETIT|nr:hypothetical protein SETIT_6G147900v2 [Setaria italica]
MHQDLSNSMPTSPSEQPSSCASVGLPEMDSAHYPVDDLMVQQPCQLHVQFCNISFKVALGMAYPVEQGPVFHGSKVLPGYSRVKLDEVCAGLDDLDLVYPGHEEVAKLGEAVHKVILWSKRYIIFGTNCNNKLSSLTKDLPHLEPVRSRSPTPPQAHIKKICRAQGLKNLSMRHIMTLSVTKMMLHQIMKIMRMGTCLSIGALQPHQCVQ